MRKLKLLIAACALMMGAGQTWAQWTDKTSLISNPSFETDDAISGAAPGQNWGSYTVTGWTKEAPSTSSWGQIAVSSSGTTFTGMNSHTAPDGDKFLFVRTNWDKDKEYIISQTIPAENLSAGVYRLTVKAAYFASKSSTYKLTLQEEGETAATYTITSEGSADYAWETWSVAVKKKSSGTTLTIKASITPGDAASGQSYCLMLDDVQLAIAENPSEPIKDNTTDQYFYNEKTGQYLSAGATWGTHAIVDNTGQPITATLSNGAYSLKTQEYNKYVNGLYMDNGSSAATWLFLETAPSSEKYYMTQDGINYMTSNGAGAEVINVTEPTDASVWTIVSKADRKAAMASATIANPANATFLLADPNFGRFNTAYSSWVWTFTNGENKNNSGDNRNFVVECYHKPFTFKQTLAAGTAPVGVYSLTAQGFYRQDGSDNDNLPKFFANDEEQTFPIRGAAAENSMTAASTSFMEGNYTIEPIYVRVESSEAFEIGAKLATNESLWCIWDNFQLTYYGDVTVAAVKMKAYVDAYNAAMTEAEAFTEASMFASDWSTLQTAISNNTLDLNDPSLTESDLTTATANLIAANTAATAAIAAKTVYNNAVALINGGTNVDLTSLLTNPGFESGNTSGWTNDGSITANAQNNTSFDNKQGTWYAERWHENGTVDLNQTIAYLPAGVYKVEAYMYSDADAKFYANSEEVSVSTSQKYHAVVTIADKGSIKIGGSCTLTGSTWICMDDFKLTYLASSIAELPYTLATGKMGTDKSAAQTDAETTFTSNPTMDNYNALLTAIAEAEASVANYTKLKSAIDKAEAVLGANNFVTAAATTELRDEISTANDAWDKVTYTDAQAITKTATLGTAVSGYHGNATGKAGNYMVSTWDTNTDGQTAGNWNGYYINTWSTEGDNDGSGFSVPFFEYFAANTENLPAKTMTATLTGLENGCYDVTIWARVQRRSDANFNDDNSYITMSVNGGEAVNIMSNTNDNVGSGGNVMRLGRYTARGMVTDGTLTLSIEVKLGSNVHWLSWRDVKYTKVADEAVEVTDAGFATYVSNNDLNYSNISGLTAYKATVEGNTIKFSSVTTVPAGEGVLLKAAKGSYNIPVTTGVASWDDNDFIRGTGANVPSVDGDKHNYILNKVNGVVGFYKANDNKVDTNRAYIQTTTNAARLNISFDDDDQTTGIARVEETVANDAVYTLSGVRVAKPTKGLYIMNGKKVVVK